MRFFDVRKLLIAAAILLATGGAAGALTADEIMQKVEDAQTAGSSAIDMVMTLVDPNGETSERRLQTLMENKDGETKSITVFMEPARVKNTRFMTISHKNRDDDQWIFLPALRKVKRIAAGEREGSFMGSDFTYADMSAANMTGGSSSHTLLREEKMDGIDCYVIRTEKGADDVYSKTVVWVDKEHMLPVKVEFYGQGGDLKKELHCSDFKKDGGRWYAAKTEMKTVETGHKTLLEIKQVKYGIKIDPRYFSTRFLETGRM